MCTIEMVADYEAKDIIQQVYVVYVSVINSLLEMLQGMKEK